MRAILITLALFVGAASGGAALDTYVQAAPSAIEIDSANALPSGTTLTVALRQAVGARVSGVGDRIAVDLVRPLATKGEVVVPIGTTIHGRVESVARPATKGNQVAISIRLDELMHRGHSIQLNSQVVEVLFDSETAVPVVGVGQFEFGEVLTREDALNHTGIGDGSVIALGTGEVDPVLAAGTRLNLRVNQTAWLR